MWWGCAVPCAEELQVPCVLGHREQGTHCQLLPRNRKEKDSVRPANPTPMAGHLVNIHNKGRSVFENFLLFAKNTYFRYLQVG